MMADFDAAFEKSLKYVDLFTRGVEVVLCKDPDVDQWIAGSRYPYQVQQGRSPLEALSAWKRCFLLQVIFDASHRAESVEMEQSVWDEMIARPNAKVHRAEFTIDGYW